MCSTVEGSEIVWAGAEEGRHEYTIKMGMILRKIIRHHEDSQRVRPEALHLLTHGERALSTKDLVKFGNGRQTKTKQKRNPLWENVPIRTQLAYVRFLCEMRSIQIKYFTVIFVLKILTI